ncbi:hypothetical protein [Flavobacterium subsaxonicum]|uniref:Uncharacterized protein n=1 Tax=Flavobacterium subsaxonicum WB 4.1-42 = DSM 21790 TaxID=1121898 RepID=A0A0A2MU48_9FLAO|nr:hypothetical protein [Flavobacterium subsaxonicum]KGO91740.1 hypothetical protein Q766_15980 [Flavobacterium subsaxonicum WB 4.1-42 = DSM 21790]
MIVFTPEVDTTKLRLAYNNDVFRFRSNSALAPLYCDIQLAGSQDFNIPDVNLRLYPDPDGNFFVNFKPYITALINTTNFQDTLSPDLQTLYPQTFLYDRTTAHYIQKGTWFRITLNDNSVESDYKIFDYICGVTQPDSRISLQKNSIYALAPFKQNTTNSYYLKYWQGYPFDVTLYVPKTGPLQVKNLTTLFSMNFSHTGQVKRLFFSDGRTDETLEDILPMQEGFNNLQLKQTIPLSANDTIDIDTANNTIYLTLQKVPYQCGVYLKWFNALGGYSYWLFEDTYSIDRSTKQLGELDFDNANIEDTLGRTLQIGKESQDTFKIIAELLTPDERTIVEGLLDSPKVYLFTGKPYARNAAQDWVEVTLKTTQARIKNPRQQLTNFTFDVELPVRYTQTL